MKSNRSKITSHLLVNHQGVEIFLYKPGTDAKEQKYFIEYNSNGRKKYYGEGSVRRKSIEFFNALRTQEHLKHARIEAQLAVIFKPDLELIISELQATNSSPVEISMRSKVTIALESFFTYKVLQYKEGTVDKISLYGYGIIIKNYSLTLK